MDPLKYVLYLFLLIGLAFLGVSVYFFFSDKNFTKTASRTNGRVINLQMGNKGGKAPIIEYYDTNGKSYIYYHNVYTTPSAYDLGQSVEIYFNPSNPEEANLGGFSVLTAVFGFLGFIFTLISVICIKGFSRHPAMTHQKRF